MKQLVILPLAALCALSAAHARDQPDAKPLRVLLVTGGHGFDRKPFLRMFEEDRGIAVHAVAHPHAQSEWSRADDFDTMVLYDLWQPIDDQAKAGFLAWLAKGKGLVVLHHALANYQAWPDYARIVGGKYFLKPATTAGRDWPASTYRHDIEFTVRVAAGDHWVVRGLADYRMRDETYHGLWVAPGVTTLLTTDEPTSHPVVGWARTEGSARVVCIQGGHDAHAYDHPTYRQIVSRAIRWTGARGG